MASLPELATRVAKKLKIPKRLTKVILWQLMDEIKAELLNEQPVMIRGLGRFYFTYQRFDREKMRETSQSFNGRSMKPGNGKAERIKVCRFRLSRRLREVVNGIVDDLGLDTSDMSRLDYKDRRRVRNIPEMREIIERDGTIDEIARRRAAGVTLGEITSRLDKELCEEGEVE